MAVVSKGQRKQYAEEIKKDGVATQKELEDAFIEHLEEFSHATFSLPDIIGHAGKVLTTDGTDVFWEEATGGGTVDGVVVEPYYYDDIRDKHLAFDTVTAIFYIDGTNKKNQFMYQVPGIVSNSVPFVIKGEYCLIGWEFFATSNVSGDAFSIRDANNSVITNLNIPTSTDNYVNETADLLIEDKRLSCRIGSAGVDTPVIKLYLKKTYYPVTGE